MNTAAPQGVDRLRRVALPLAALGVIACVVGAVVSRDQFVRSYLTAYLFWSGIAIGCLPLLLLHHLAGGRWGYMIRRFLEAGAKTLPVVAVLFLPLLLDLPALYSWARPEVVAHDPVIQHKAAYLNVPFFLVRAAGYFAIWIGLGTLLCRWGLEQERRRDQSLAGKLRALGAIGLGLYGLATTFAMIDWAMSLDPHWFSTMFGLLFAVGQVLSALALGLICLRAFHRQRPLADVARPEQINDLGNLLLAFVMLWAYLAFSQFLIIWSGNLREEIPWYLHRLGYGWQTLAIVLLVFHFALPFLVLLSPTFKRNPVTLGKIAGWLLLMRVVDIYWNVAPTWSEHTVQFHWLDVATLVGVGGVWVTLFARYLQAQSVLPGYDVRVVEEAPHE